VKTCIFIIISRWILLIFFSFNRHCNPCGFWPAQIPLVFSAGRFLQSAFASGTSNPQPGGPVIRTFQLPPETTRANPSSREFCRKWRLSRHFWVLLHAVNLRHGTDRFTSPPKEGALRIFSPEKSDGFGRDWTRKLGYQRPARLPLDHRSRCWILLIMRKISGKKVVETI